MSTLPSLASKGEKAKPKFQSLDINNLYRVSLGENLENKQQKSTLSQKHGMQSLGKVPNARRPPANLPSLKSEHSGNDAAVPLVPSNGSGWGKQENSSTATSTITTNSTTTSTNSSAPPANPQQQQQTTPSSQQASNKQQQQQSANPAIGDKSWSAVMSGVDPNSQHPPPYQSPQFQHEFPSLAGEGGQPLRTGAGGAAAGVDSQYGPGPSLRPQTEGSWLLGGGSRGTAVETGRNSAAAAPQLTGPVGQQLPPQCLGFVPPFMYRGSNFAAANGHGATGNIQQQQQQQLQMQQHQQQHQQSQSQIQRRMQEQSRAQRNLDMDELVHRPIIKEEDLSGMDSLTNEMGWAINDEIDYNQKLAFSDDEKSDEVRTKPSRSSKDTTNDKTNENASDHGKSWNNRNQSGNQNRNRIDDEEITMQRRRQQQDLAIAVERAKQRKEEEEKKFLETKQAAAKKLQELDERLGKKRSDKDVDDNAGTIPPGSVPPQALAPVPILLPEWEREKEIRSKPAATQQNDSDDQQLQQQQQQQSQQQQQKGNQRDSDFRQLTQLDRYAVARKEGRISSSGSGNEKDSNFGPNFSKQFQNNLPPRFQKKQQLGGNQQNISYGNDARWAQSSNRTSPGSSGGSSNRKGRDAASEDKEHDDRYRRYEGEYRSHRYDSGRKYDDYKDYDYKKEDDKLRSRDNRDKFDSSEGLSRQSSEEWHSSVEKRDKYERPQRPDSRDSRASRESRHSGDSNRHSESRDYGSWSDAPSQYKDPYEERKKEHRMVVPGPITKEKIEADDLRNEKRNLTQLKRGAGSGPLSANDKKQEKSSSAEKDDDNWMKRIRDDGPKAWADAVPTAIDGTATEEEKLEREEIKDKFGAADDHEKKMHGGRNRSDSQGSRGAGGGGGGGQQWSSSSGTVYRGSWTTNKKAPGSARNPPRGSSQRSHAKGEFTESEGSMDDISAGDLASKKLDGDKKDLKDDKDKGDKSKDKNHFVPRGEPSRHGRGGSSSTYRSARGSGKRLDGYGGPPGKGDEKKDVESEEEKKGKSMQKLDDKSGGRRKEARRSGSGSGGAPIASSSSGKSKTDDMSDNSDADARKSKPFARASSSTMSRRSGPPSRPVNIDKRPFGGPNRNDPKPKPAKDSLGGRMDPRDKEKESNNLLNAIVDNTLKDDSVVLDTEAVDDGFQEVKNKKLDRKLEKPIVGGAKEEKPKIGSKQQQQQLQQEKDAKKLSAVTKVGQQLSQQQIANIPSLMATPVNPPPNMSQKFDRNGSNINNNTNNRQTKLPPRFAKARENSRMKSTGQLHNEEQMVKVSQSGMYGGLKDVPLATSLGNAWDKPLGPPLRQMDQELMASLDSSGCKVLDGSVHPNVVGDGTVLDGSKPLNTIIFENTNYKSAPGARNRNDKPAGNNRGKLDENLDGNGGGMLQNFGKPIGDLLGKDKRDDMQMPLFNKEDSADMKLDFLESEISQITEDNNKSSSSSSSKNMLPRTMHQISSSTNSQISNADALNIKIQSVKKVWDMATAMEQQQQQQLPHNSDENSFTSSFVSDANVIDGSAFSKGSDVVEDSHDVYNSSAQVASNSSTTNVCKVKPTQQVAGSGQTILNAAGTHQQHSIVGPGLMGHSLSSPPPLPPVLGGGGVGLGQPPQQFTGQHIGYQTGLGGTQYGLPAPSPPTVLYNSTQQMPAQAAGLYGTFQLDQSQVLGGQGRSQFSQFSYNLGQAASSAYSQSVYLQTQPHAPPPTAQAPPDLYQNMSNFRMTNTAGPFGQNQQLNQQSTVLISSSSNSLMSSTVKPSNNQQQQQQQISAIGTKAGGVGQAYQQSQQTQQMYMYEPINASYLQNTGVIQRASAVQNNVVPAGLQASALQPSSSFYSGSAGAQTNYYQNPTNSSLQSAAAQMQQHQAAAGYGGLQGNVFNAHPNQSHSSGPMQNYGSPYLSGPMQLAMNATPFRSSTLPNNSYMKGGGQQIGDQGRQQLKSPGGQQEVLSSVFNSAPPIASPKSRTMKQPPPQPSPTSQHKYLYNTNINSQQQQQQQAGQRLPTPIQRPGSNYQMGGGGGPGGGGAQNQKHRSNNSNSRTSSRQYYGNQGGSINTQSAEKSEESSSKLNDSSSASSSAAAATTANNTAAKPVTASSAASAVQQAAAAAAAVAAVTAASEKGGDVKEDSCHAKN